MTPPLPRRRVGAPVATVTRLVPAQPVAESTAPEVQGTLALDLHGGRPGLPETPELDHGRTTRVEHLADGEVRAWAARFAQAAIETIAGHRPVSQLVRWTSPEVYRELDRRAQTLAQVAAGSRSRGLRPQVRSLHLCRPAPDAVEISVHVRHGERSRAVAMRLERRNERWLCTVLQFV